MDSSFDKIKSDRIAVAKLIVEVVLGKLKVLQALKMFPLDSKDDSVRTCFHILVHFESDEEMRAKDTLYKEVQDEFLVETAETLAKGESLPVNVIMDYKNYYGEDLFYSSDMSKADILKRLGKTINL